jgi:mRNA-degrading endonuclease RelE of RelBE toxin-antitoxin system
MIFQTLSHFDRELKRLLKKYPSIGQDLKLLLESLETNPTQGDALGKDCYKVRMAISSKNKGKSGGARVITCLKILDETIILLSIYDKSEQNDIPNDLINRLLKDKDLL